MAQHRGVTRRAAIASGAAIVASAVSGCLGGGGGGPQTIETTFDDGKEGWTAVDHVSHDADADPDWGTIERSLEVTHAEDGGVEGSGHISRVDTTSDAFFFASSDAYAGDRSGYAGGRLEFQLRSTHNNWRPDSAVILDGADGVVTTAFELPQSEWTQYEIALDADARDFHESNLNGPAANQDRLEAVLADLQAVRISGEHGGQVEEEVGLDEVRLRPP